MKIVFTGGGTGGHFYPIIAVAQELNDIIDQENLANVKLYYFSTEEYDPTSLFEQHLEFVRVPSGKLRHYFSIKNFIDVFKVMGGTMVALWKLYSIFPDVVFGKGGFASFPTLVAARVLGIPVIIHESDSVPGRVNQIVSKWAKRIAISYEEAITFLPKEKTAHTGQPVRRELSRPITEGAHEYLKLEPGLPTVVIFGGSGGAQLINDTILEILPELVKKYQVIHQVGPKNIEEAQKMADSVLAGNEFSHRYKAFGFLNALASSMAAGVASVVVSRAGSQLFEIAAWGTPSIIIPRTNSINDHNRKNAYNYARTGACTVIEEENLEPHILLSEINYIVDHPEVIKTMHEGTLKFYQPDAGRVIAREIVDMALQHER